MILDHYVALKKGIIYDHTNGSQYKCLSPNPGTDALLERVSDGWTLVAHGTRMDEHGLICWNYSTGGHWPDKAKREQKIRQHQLVLDKYPHPPYNQRNDN